MMSVTGFLRCWRINFHILRLLQIWFKPVALQKAGQVFVTQDGWIAAYCFVLGFGFILFIFFLAALLATFFGMS